MALWPQPPASRSWSSPASGVATRCSSGKWKSAGRSSARPMRVKAPPPLPRSVHRYGRESDMSTNLETSADQSPILVTEQDGIATITLNRPTRMNAMNVALALDMKQQLLRLLDDDSVRVLVFAGAG